MQALTAFQSHYPKYLEQLHVWSRLRGRSNRLTFVVRNAGRAEAEAVNVILRFPDDVVVRPDIDKPPDRPPAPRDPTVPAIVDTLAAMTHTTDAAQVLNRVIGHVGTNPDIPTIRPANSIEVVYGPNNVRHGFQWRPRPVWIVLPERVLGTFNVPYAISARNLPQVVEGTIQITPVYQYVGSWLAPDDPDST